MRLPGGRKLIIDAKCSLNAFLDPPRRSTRRSAQRISRPTPVDPQSRPAARRQELLGPVGDAADYVVMYIRASISSPPRWSRTTASGNGRSSAAFSSRRRPISSPSPAPSPASGGRRSSPREAAEIARSGKDLHASLAVMAGHITRLGKNWVRPTTPITTSWAGLSATSSRRRSASRLWKFLGGRRRSRRCP